MCRERKDSLGEEKVNEFLREHLYGGKYGLVKTRYSLDGSKVVIDEKFALYYPTPRKKINTFAFELKTEINAHEDN